MTVDHTEQCFLVADGFKRPATLSFEGKRIFISFGYNKTLLNEIKQFDGAKWHGYETPPRKCWSIANTPRNLFQLEYLKGNNPYIAYDAPLRDYIPSRKLFKHQIEMVKHALTRKCCIFACEMGTGKTLAAIEVMERAGVEDHEAWYVGPRSGVMAVGREIVKWESAVHPRMFTYEGLTSMMETWQDGNPAPKIVIFDECSKLKTPTSKRSQHALHLANAVRNEHGENGYVILMSGTPAPKSPLDWWHQCEVACPGFLVEGNINKMRKRLSITEERESAYGGIYPHHIAWLDDESKCAVCGEFETSENHSPVKILSGQGHYYQKSKNEVAYLYERLKGLVLVQFKKDCLDLPDKTYRLEYVKPTVDTLRVAKLITQTATRSIEALTLLRELSDGFMYEDQAGDMAKCERCGGTGKITIKVPKRQINELEVLVVNADDFEVQTLTCDNCGGSGEIRTYKRGWTEAGTPKDELFKQLLDDHDDIGRFIVWGGFTATLDRLTKMAMQEGWDVLQVDGRGYKGFSHTGATLDSTVLLDAMDGSHPKREKLMELYPKVCFVGHPQAGGMGLTLTSAPTMLFYSNCFNGEARMQAEDRFHRAGMDTNRGATIIDVIHLSTDKLILDNLKKKKDLQLISMGELEQVMSEKVETEDVRR